MLELVAYLIFCALTGLLGVHRRMGFFGTFALTVLFTPLLVLPVLFFTGPSNRFEWHPRE
jgi:hypothetical protein